jgi:AcrR family transcriptional regulator
MAPETERTDEASRRVAIHAAAIREFSARGFAATSMANIADAVGMSRPALYQYFENKRDIFASAFAALIDASVDRALAALLRDGTVAHQLDGFLQRFDGDLWEQMAASPHSHEIVDAKYELAADAIAVGLARLRKGLEVYLRRTGAPRAQRVEWAEVLDLSPKGFKFDQPSVDVYRRRLSTLARTVAADIDAVRTQG